MNLELSATRDQLWNEIGRPDIYVCRRFHSSGACFWRTPPSLITNISSVRHRVMQRHAPLLNSSAAASAPSAKLTFTPRVEEHDDVLAAAVSCRRLALHGAAGHRQPVEATHGAGRRVDRQLRLAAALLHNLGRPAFVLRGVHEEDGGVGAFGHRGQGTYSTGGVSSRAINMKLVHSSVQLRLNTTQG